MSGVKDEPIKNGSGVKLSNRKSVLFKLLGIVCLVLVIGRRSSFMQTHDLLNTNTTVTKDKTDEIKAKSDFAFAQIGTDVEKIGSNMKKDPLRKTSRKNKGGIGQLSLSIDIDEDHEPYLNRWQRRFASSKVRNKKGGYLFFRHTRKAGGTSLRAYFQDVLLYHNITRTVDDFRAVKKKSPDSYQIYYIEHEFQSMDWQCPSVDPRWQESIRIIVLRHPIERHLSEYFFSGAGNKFAPIDKQQLYVNKTYTDALTQHISKYLPKWTKGIGINRHKEEGIEGLFNMIFSRRYTDNFQLRALAGCSSGDCLKEKKFTEDQMEKIYEFHPSSYSYSTPVPRCTQYWRNRNKTALFEQCAKSGHIVEECSIGCDGPCFYPSAAWHKMDSIDVTRAVTALKAFDAVLLMEKLDDEDQADFLSDIMGVPRDAEFSLVKRGDIISNSGVVKSGKREKTHFYRDLLVKLGLKHELQTLRKENELEIEFFHHAEKLNEMMINQWKKESSGTT
eukprot:CAMPEP_0172301980 /NCGR_PEP_ID=MMETSP1058-20130122/3765_1 /TAXON_ID=83371 /ORGANISM="Detonula confervacea, Strain CCMP 353" /LENGTH=502 /DNA_ID=CAMNT_0013012303 /DNA_START=128 /DNA_END=1636 /DNA_ORIENTATION=-